MSKDTIGRLRGTRLTKKYSHLLMGHFTRYADILTSKRREYLFNIGDIETR